MNARDFEFRGNAHVPTDNGPALPRYVSDPDQAEADRWEAVTATDSFGDWLSEQCCDDVPYRGPLRYMEAQGCADALVIDNAHAQRLTTPQLTALALGATQRDKPRIAAMDELARRFFDDKFPGVT